MYEIFWFLIGTTQCCYLNCGVLISCQKNACETLYFKLHNILSTIDCSFIYYPLLLLTQYLLVSDVSTSIQILPSPCSALKLPTCIILSANSFFFCQMLEIFLYLDHIQSKINLIKNGVPLPIRTVTIRLQAAAVVVLSLFNG